MHGSLPTQKDDSAEGTAGEQAKTSFAWAGHHRVRLVDGTRCPHCGQSLHPTGVSIADFGEVRLVCHGCHRDVLSVEPPDWIDDEGQVS